MSFLFIRMLLQKTNNIDILYDQNFVNIIIILFIIIYFNYNIYFIT